MKIGVSERIDSRKSIRANRPAIRNGPSKLGNGMRGVGSFMVGFVLFGAPRFQSRGPRILILKGCGTPGLKIGAPQKPQTQPRQIQPPILGPLILASNTVRTKIIADPKNVSKN